MSGVGNVVILIGIRMVFIVLIDFFCWILIIIIGIVLLLGMEVSLIVYVWIVVFVLFLNFVLNLIFYIIFIVNF